LVVPGAGDDKGCGISEVKCGVKAAIAAAL